MRFKNSAQARGRAVAARRLGDQSCSEGDCVMNPVHLVLLGWLALLLLGSLGAFAVANDRSPRQLKPLDQIVESLENTGYVVVEVEVDHGHWEVDAHKGDESYELHIEPTTGKIIA